MTSINFNNSYPYNNQLQRYNAEQQNQQSFQALDRKQLQQDAVEIANKGKKSNPMLDMLNIDINNPKKTITSIGLMALTTILVAGFFNKNVGKISDLGLKVDDIFLNNKPYQAISGLFKKAKDGVVKFLRKSKTLDDVFDTLKNRKAKPVSTQARGTGQGYGSMFGITPGENLSNLVKNKKSKVFKSIKTELKNNNIAGKDKRNIMALFEKDEKAGFEALEKAIGSKARNDFEKQLQPINDDILNSFKNLVGEDKAQTFLDKLGSKNDNQAFCKELTNIIADKFNLRTANGELDYKKLNKFLQSAKKDGFVEVNGTKIDLSAFTNIDMVDGGLIGSWGPVNLINFVGKKIRGDKWKGFCRGNFFDSLLKYNMVTNNMAKTAPARLLHKTIGAADVISNHVNDKSTMGLFACLMGMSAFANMYDAPKEKKFSTAANDFTTQVTGLAITTPMAFATTYGLASLKNLKGDGVGSKILRTVGRFFHIGLGKKANPVNLTQSLKTAFVTKSAKPALDALKRMPKAALSKAGGFVGGAMRFGLVMFVFGGLFAKPVNKLVQKVFGKPYDPSEEANEMEKQEALKNNANLQNMTEEQLLARLQAHPEVIQEIQNDPKMLQAVQKDPSILLQIAAMLPDNFEQTQPAAQNTYSNLNTQSQLLRKYLNSQNNQVSPYGMQQNPFNTQNSANSYSMPAPNINNGQKTSSNSLDEIPEPKRSYIPSSKPLTLMNAVEIDGETITNPNVQSVLLKADRAEQDAMRFF